MFNSLLESNPFTQESRPSVCSFPNLGSFYVIQEIEEVDTDEHYRPKSPIGIIDITLKQEP